jgi:hypothetical protein
VCDGDPEPVEAVMVTVLEFVAFQLSVTVSPDVMVLLSAEKTSEGVAGWFCEGLPLAPPHAQRPKRAQIRPAKPILLTKFSFIPKLRPHFTSRVQMPCCQPSLLRGNPEATGLPGLQ